jgi:hypothetical protein
MVLLEALLLPLLLAGAMSQLSEVPTAAPITPVPPLIIVFR